MKNIAAFMCLLIILLKSELYSLTCSHLYLILFSSLRSITYDQTTGKCAKDKAKTA